MVILTIVIFELFHKDLTKLTEYKEQ
jgi:hypothetical protein